jgi:hypothetical protein
MLNNYLFSEKFKEFGFRIALYLIGDIRMHILKPHKQQLKKNTKIIDMQKILFMHLIKH